MLGLNKDIVKLVPYEKDWANEFEKEKKILKEVLGEYALDIQHVGSTAIPGIVAKPVLDIAVAVESLDILEILIPILTDAGYDVKNSIEDNNEILARKGSPECRTHYIHIEVLNGEFWKHHILFRDYMLKHPEAVVMYEKIKKESFSLYKDYRKKYTESKHKFIRKILEKAEKEIF